ncbi:MAG TPA: AAA family ATPase [Candidatus Limnocylindrales bacterium]|nr:AAA family ATPase [Candidatus Limnocylindrales bacterium]
MTSTVTVGHPAALSAVGAMLAGRAPHAVLLVGPPSVGKTTLALDLAAGLLCTGAVGGDRPCRNCRACRMVAHGNHPDLHRLAPEGPGDQIGIGGRDRPRGVRDLVAELALLPVEGIARVATVERAHRMSEDAQSALLKTLEEPPSATVLILCADDEERLLPTVRSRCARIRLGAVATRDIEGLVVGHGLADAPTAARLARIAAGRPGLALTYAAAPEAVRIRGEIVRTLLDLADDRIADRLARGRDLLGRAGEMSAALAAPAPGAAATNGAARSTRTRSGSAPSAVAPSGAAGSAGEPAEPELDAEPSDTSAVRVPAAERRRALLLLLDLWADVARDLAVAAAGAAAAVRDPGLIDEVGGLAARLTPEATGAALARVARARELVEANASPELVLDVLLLRWPRTAGGPRRP